METLVLHPEELFDKASKGLATADELARLEAHVAQCTTCRFERQVRLDFDAVGGSTADLDGLVARALSGAKAAPQAPGRRRVGPMLIAAAVALMGFGSFAAVAQFTGVLPRFIESLSERTPVDRPSTPLRRNGAAPVVPSEVEGPATEPQVEVLPPPPPPVVVEAPRVVARPVRKTIEVAPLPDPLPLPAPSPPAALPAAQREGETSAELFARATQARVRGEVVEAIRGYRDVVGRFPGTAEANLSQAQLGRLLLDRGETPAALEAFDAYLGSKDQTLREEVQGARAMALQVLGRVDEERSAWEAVLHDYPSGVYAPRARTRLESLTP